MKKEDKELLREMIEKMDKIIEIYKENKIKDEIPLPNHGNCFTMCNEKNCPTFVLSSLKKLTGRYCLVCVTIESIISKGNEIIDLHIIKKYFKEQIEFTKENFKGNQYKFAMYIFQLTYLLINKSKRLGKLINEDGNLIPLNDFALGDLYHCIDSNSCEYIKYKNYQEIKKYISKIEVV